MKPKPRSPRSYRAVPELVEVPSRELAAEVGGAARLVLGRREWLLLPELGVGPLRAKIDTGARTSSLHVEDLRVSEDGRWVEFVTRDRDGRVFECRAEVSGRARVKSSTGVARRRYHIETEAILPGGFRWRIRLTLANRQGMKCPMLLGRRALAGFFLIDPEGDHLMGALRDFDLPGSGTKPS